MHFLIVKTSSLGDIIQTFPVIEYLRNKYPSSQIDWVVEEEYASLLCAHPEIHKVYTISSRRWRHHLFRRKMYQELLQTIRFLKENRYDAVFDLQGNTKSALLSYFSQSSSKVGFGRRSVAEMLNLLATNKKFEVDASLPIQQRYLSVVQQYFNDNSLFKHHGVQLRLTLDEEAKFASYHKPTFICIMVAFASKWKNKSLPLEAWISFLQELYHPEQTLFYFVCGTEEEKKRGERLASHFPHSILLQNLSFPLWQRLMNEMQLVIGVDSAALALCGTTSTPSFSFFGPTQASVYKPLGDQHLHYQGHCPYGVKFSSRCPRLRSCKTGFCLRDLPSSQKMTESLLRLRNHLNLIE